MRFLQSLFGKGRRPYPLGLADPDHPARRWIDAAVVIADRRLDLSLVEGRPAIQANTTGLRDLVGALDVALGEAPNDPDLLVARASARYLLQEITAANDDLDRALRVDSRHCEAGALRRYGKNWHNLFFLPGWSPNSRRVHSVLAEKANQGDALHCVRHSLQAACVLLLVGNREDFSGTPTRCRWEVVCSETPFGPIGAHYALIDMGGSVRRQECILAPSTERSDTSAPPPPLLGRLASVRTCFVVVAESSGQVLHNMQYNLPEDTRRTLAKLSRLLFNASGSRASDIRGAAEWHMRHFDMDSVVFPEG